ncbi:glycosyltransferase family 2 protein [Brevirhabdus sp.]|uniref:glycosyltransferase family 2 protein n=1 Tax=Brevirhabdus sp. TaxID=2004514 RepID=UPI004058C374
MAKDVRDENAADQVAAGSQAADDIDEPTAGGDALPLWFDELSPGGSGEGFFEKTGKHSLMFVRRPVNRLLVSFDNLANVNDRSAERVPWAFKFARDLNLSHLGVMANVADWYRDADLIARMQELAAKGFFDGYDRVVFAGASMGGFAALSFGSLVPGAHVVAFNPQSTLDERLIPWEDRYWSGRRQDWTLPLSDAAGLTAGLGQVSIFYDPYHEPDVNHMRRLSGDNVHEFKCWFSGHKSAVMLRKIGALKGVMTRAVMDDLNEADFYRAYRGRRSLKWYRKALCGYFDDRGRDFYSQMATRRFRALLRGAKQDTPAIAAAAPALTAPARNDKVVVVTTMKNEGPFMLEWIAYNRSIGFTDFMIYTNGCEDGTDAIARRLEKLGLALHQDNRFKEGASPQRVALRRGFNHEYTKDADWLICADCDEFLNIRAGDGTLPALFDATGYADAISVCWKIFGSGDQVEYRDEMVVDQFKWAAPEVYFDKYKARGLKTLVRRNDKLLRLSVHRPKFAKDVQGLVWKDAGGQAMPDSYLTQGWSAHPKFAHDHARLHHYAVRSVDSFLVKRDRGRTNHIDRDQGMSYWADMNLNQVEDRSIEPRIPAARRELDALMADPELKRLHEAAVEWHRTKIAELKARDGWSEFRETIRTMNRCGEAPVDKSGLAPDAGWTDETELEEKWRAQVAASGVSQT